MDNAQTKIAIVSYSLGGGGAERFAGTLSFALEKLGYEIHHIIINHQVDYPYSGTLYSLEQQFSGSSGWLKKIKKGFLLHRYLKENQISIVIDNRTRNHFCRELSSVLIYKKCSVYYMIHSFSLKNYFPKNRFAAKLLYQNATKLICVSKAIQSEVERLYALKNTEVIYNPVQKIELLEHSFVLPAKYVLYFGRIDKNKNLSLLLSAFSESKVYQLGCQLVILGDGPDKKSISDLIQELHLSDSVQLLPFEKNPFDIVRQAQFTVLTSQYEGFPMSIIESLSLGVPVVSVDCPSGPSEVIVSKQNGLLVKNHDVAALSEAIKSMILDEELLNRCRKNAVQSVAHLSIDFISEQWRVLFEASKN